MRVLLVRSKTCLILIAQNIFLHFAHCIARQGIEHNIFPRMFEPRQHRTDQMHHANERCKEAIEIGNPDLYYTANSEFHALIYQQCGNGYMEQHAIHLHRRLKPFRRQQLRLRGRMAQSMAEHEAILEALNKGNAAAAQNALRNHVAVQGEKFFHLMSSLKSAEHNN